MAPSKAVSEDAQSAEKRRAFGWIRGGGGGGGKSTPRRKGLAVTDSGTPKTSNTSVSAQAAAAAAAATTSETTPSKVKEGVPSSANSNSKQQPAGILKNQQDSAMRAAATKEQTPAVPLKKPSWFCRTAHFSRMCDMAFDVVDSDRSGTVDEGELYAGLLLIHLKLGTYAGPAACRPLSRERCKAIFSKMDLDGSKALDRGEFRNVMAVLFSNVVLRVVVQWSMTLMIVPWAAQAILKGIMWLTAYVTETIATLDEHSEVANSIELTVEDAAAWCLEQTPTSLLSAANRVSKILAMVPESVWKVVPLTLLSTVLGIVVVPWCIFQVDDFFQRVADRKAERGPWI